MAGLGGGFTRFISEVFREHRAAMLDEKTVMVVSSHRSAHAKHRISDATYF